MNTLEVDARNRLNERRRMHAAISRVLHTMEAKRKNKEIIEGSDFGIDWENWSAEILAAVDAAFTSVMISSDESGEYCYEEKDGTFEAYLRGKADGLRLRLVQDFQGHRVRQVSQLILFELLLLINHF